MAQDPNLRAAPPFVPSRTTQRTPPPSFGEGPAGSGVRSAERPYWTVMTSANTTLGPVPAVPDPVKAPAMTSIMKFMPKPL